MRWSSSAWVSIVSAVSVSRWRSIRWSRRASTRVFPPLESLDAQPGNLPVQHSSFVGRQREVAEVAALLGDTRIVTLTGVGGVGKTRLACQVAAEALPQFPHGAWLVELDRVRDPDVVVDAVVGVFDLPPRPGVELVETLVSFLRSKELLLVLDNCEHLLTPVAALIRALEGACPGLVVLATSREGLGLAGERIVAVPSLGVPGSDDCDGVAGSEAVRVFVERAQAVSADFTVTDENAPAVAEVVRRLDGIPLALELAAARIPVLSPAQLAQRLDQRFRLLAGGERGAVERHATLRAAIDWSYDLLAPAEQLVLARLSVFAGGCSLEAAESVCCGGGVDELDVLDLLAVLVARSLVVADDAASGERRYRLLETVRQYAEERLDDGDHEELRERHSRYYADFVESAVDRVAGPGPVAVAAEGQRRTGEPPRRAGVGGVARRGRSSGALPVCRRQRAQRAVARHAARCGRRFSTLPEHRSRSSGTRSHLPRLLPRRCSTARSTAPSSSVSGRWTWRKRRVTSSCGQVLQGPRQRRIRAG